MDMDIDTTLPATIAVLAVLLGIGLIASALIKPKNNTDEHLTRNVCTRDRVDLRPVVRHLPNGTGGFIPFVQFIPIVTCLESRTETYKNPDYDPKTRNQ